jgi:hypothetical protein
VRPTDRRPPWLSTGTYAHPWPAAGGTEGDLQELAGWKSPQMLARYGASARAERAAAAYQRLDLEGEL